MFTLPTVPAIASSDCSGGCEQHANEDQREIKQEAAQFCRYGYETDASAPETTSRQPHTKKTPVDFCDNGRTEEQLKNVTGSRRSRSAQVRGQGGVQVPTSTQGWLPCALYLTAKCLILAISFWSQDTFTAILPPRRLKDTSSGGPHRSEKSDFLSFEQKLNGNSFILGACFSFQTHSG